MRSANNPILVGLVLLFVLGHFLLLVGILMRIGATCWRQIVRAKGLGLRRSTSRSTSRTKDQEAAYEANRMQLL
jgi:hypothetical protein